MNNSGDPAEALSKVLSSEPVRNLLAPVTREIGEALGDLGSIVRFYSYRNLSKIFAKWAASRATVSPSEFENVMPLLLLAAYASDDELQTRWAALLESAAVEADGFLPSFGRTLSELTAEEARFLDRLWKNLSVPLDHLSEHRHGRQPISYFTLIKTFDSNIETNISEVEFKVFRHRMNKEREANYRMRVHADLVIQDLRRLGLLVRDPVVDSTHSLRLLGGAPVAKGESALLFEYSLTEYGVSFIRAVTPRD